MLLILQWYISTFKDVEIRNAATKIHFMKGERCEVAGCFPTRSMRSHSSIISKIRVMFSLRQIPFCLAERMNIFFLLQAPALQKFSATRVRCQIISYKPRWCSTLANYDKAAKSTSNSSSSERQLLQTYYLFDHSIHDERCTIVLRYDKLEILPSPLLRLQNPTQVWDAQYATLLRLAFQVHNLQDSENYRICLRSWCLHLGDVFLVG